MLTRAGEVQTSQPKMPMLMGARDEQTSEPKISMLTGAFEEQSSQSKIPRLTGAFEEQTSQPKIPMLTGMGDEQTSFGGLLREKIADVTALLASTLETIERSVSPRVKPSQTDEISDLWQRIDMDLLQARVDSDLLECELDEEEQEEKEQEEREQEEREQNRKSQHESEWSSEWDPSSEAEGHAQHCDTDTSVFGDMSSFGDASETEEEAKSVKGEVKLIVRTLEGGKEAVEIQSMWEYVEPQNPSPSSSSSNQSPFGGCLARSPPMQQYQTSPPMQQYQTSPPMQQYQTYPPMQQYQTSLTAQQYSPIQQQPTPHYASSPARQVPLQSDDIYHVLLAQLRGKEGGPAGASSYHSRCSPAWWP